LSIVILRLAAALYAGAAAGYIVHFARPRHRRAATVGFWLLAAAFAVHAVAIGVGCSEFGGRSRPALRPQPPSASAVTLSRMMAHPDDVGR